MAHRRCSQLQGRPRPMSPPSTGVTSVSPTGATGSTNPAPSSTNPDPPVATTPTASSFLTAYSGPGIPSTLDSLASIWGYQPTYVSDYFDGSSWAGIADDQWDLSQWQGTGYQMVWGVPMLPSSGSASLAVGATGAYNLIFCRVGPEFSRSWHG